MARPSSIEVLPQDILEKLQELLRDKRVSQLGVVASINALLEENGHDEKITKSSLNRYAQKMEKVGEKLRQAREVADVYISKLGNAPQGKTGQLINELIRTMTFDVAMKAAEGELASPDLLKDLALTMQRLEKAASLNEEREEKIREQERTRVTEEATKFVRDQGLSVGQESELRNFLLQVS